MPKLPVLSGQKLVKILVKKGFKVVSNKGSHVRLKKFTNGKKPLIVTVPLHKELMKGTLRAILRQAQLAPEEL